MILNALPRLSMTQGNVSAISAESKLWDPPPKNGTSTSDKELPPDWQQLLK